MKNVTFLKYVKHRPYPCPPRRATCAQCCMITLTCSQPPLTDTIHCLVDMIHCRANKLTPIRCMHFFAHLLMLRYDYPWSKDVFDAWITTQATVDPFTGVAELVKQDYDVCNSLLGNKRLMAAIADADVMVVDMAWRCGSVVRDVAKIKIRVDFHPVTFADPFFFPRLGSSNPIHSIPQMGSKIPRVDTFGARVSE